ncbi:MAG: 16S rRNA (guanine(966)-N(2))-methyltransferase RsmD [Gemmataceae bacterium]
MRTDIRIVAGELRGRKVLCTVNPKMRPTPQRVREALFSILGDAVPERLFFDVFAGTGVIGLEAISRGARHVTFVERDFRSAADIEKHLSAFGVRNQAAILRSDVYRWAERWQPQAEPVNVFFSPPFDDFEHKLPDLLLILADLQLKLHAGSVLVVQSERTWELDKLPVREQWEQRVYGRNELLIWVKVNVGKGDVPATVL